MTDKQKEIIRALADNDMKVSRVAEKLYMHHNTVLYHIDKIRDTTGKDPQRFYDLQELLTELK